MMQKLIMVQKQPNYLFVIILHEPGRRTARDNYQDLAILKIS